FAGQATCGLQICTGDLAWAKYPGSAFACQRSDHFDGDSHGFAPADAQRSNPFLATGLAQGAYQRGHQARTGRTNRMTQSGGPTVDIDLSVVQLEVVHGGHGYNGKGLVDFEKVDVANAPAGFVEQFLYGTDRCSGKPF